MTSQEIEHHWGDGNALSGDKNSSGEMKMLFLEMKHTSVETPIGGFPVLILR